MAVNRERKMIRVHTGSDVDIRWSTLKDALEKIQYLISEYGEDAVIDTYQERYGDTEYLGVYFHRAETDEEMKHRIAEGFWGMGQGVVRCHSIDKTHLTQNFMQQLGVAGRGHKHANGQIVLARFQGRQGARQSFVTNAQAGGRVERQKALAQFHHHRPGNDAVHGHREDRLPTRGHALDAVGQGVHVVE